jgi:hypothetical protein
MSYKCPIFSLTVHTSGHPPLIIANCVCSLQLWAVLPLAGAPSSEVNQLPHEAVLALPGCLISSSRSLVRFDRAMVDHIMSNIAALTCRGLFCKTTRLFLQALRRNHPELRHLVPRGLAGRYLKEEGEATSYEDARSDASLVSRFFRSARHLRGE